LRHQFEKVKVDRRRAIGRTQLIADVIEMFGHRARRNVQPRRDFFVRQTIRDELNDLDLALR
jgi:hypothetical protein